MFAQRIDEADGCICIRLSGTVSDEGQSLQTLGLEAGDLAQRILIDLQDVSLLNSSGIGLLLKLHRNASEQQGTVILHDVPRVAQQVLDFMKLSDILTIVNDRRDADEVP